MARKSNEQIAAEERERQRVIKEEAAAMAKSMVQDMMPALVAELLKARVDTGTSAPTSAEGRTADKALLEGLAHAMAKASDPGNRRRIVAPEIMQERAEANTAMRRAIMEHHAKGEMPVYVVVRPTFLNEMMIQPQFFNPLTKVMEDQEIDWPGIPNQAMVPKNDFAREIHTLYLKSIGARAGHFMMGFKKVGDDIEPSDVPLENLDAPIVLTGKEIRRGHRGAPLGSEVAISDALLADPRRGNPASKPKTQHVLGTTAQPAVIS